MTQMMILTTATMKVMTTNSNHEDLALIIVAAGSSSRMGGIKKEYLPMNGGTVLSSSAKVFLQSLPFSKIAVTYPSQNNSIELKNSEEKCRSALFAHPSVKERSSDVIFVAGGSSRQASVFNALKEIKKHFNDSNPIVFIHDGARPFVTEEIIADAYKGALEAGAAVPGIQPVDTQNELDESGCIKRHLIRSLLTAVQTPQVFHLDQLLKAHQLAQDSGREYTDDTEIWDLFVPGGKVKVTKGNPSNKKITYKEDIDFPKEHSAMIRTGLGYDKHALVSGRKLMLGGIEIESDLGEDGHSDGDVLLHAITDALLGASGLGDIGSYFPPSDPKWKGADSKELLKTVWADVKAKGWKLGNLDCVIALEKPKFLPHRQKVIESISSVLEVNQDQIFVKAKTGEKLGDIGQRRAVEVWATCLLEK